MQSASLSQQQKQTAKLSPTQIQVIRMLELPSVELNKRINEELEANPALEEGVAPSSSSDASFESEQEGDDFFFEGQDDFADSDSDYLREREPKDILQNEDFNYEAYVSDDETPEYIPSSNSLNGADDKQWDREGNMAGGTTLLEELKAQIYLTKMTKSERHIAKWVIGNIDDDGYLTRSIEQLVDDLSFQEGLIVSDAQMADIVRQIKDFEPAGVASSCLQESLITQLRRKPSTPARELAITILTHHFDTFAKHHFSKITLRLGCSDAQLQEAIDEIHHLNQKPANAFTGNIDSERHRSTIIPDFFVENRDGELILSLNTGDIPDLRVSEDYLLMQSSYQQPRLSAKEKEAAKFIREKIESARGFIDAIQQRNDTLMRTMTAIIQFQRDWFLEGDDSHLKPMILQHIADKTGLDVSTISRVSNSKYVRTEYGTFPLKHFFSESMLNSDGDEISTREVKQFIASLIQSEDKSNPITDEQIMARLADKGYPIARRTVAKYRDQLGIPVARLRKR